MTSGQISRFSTAWQSRPESLSVVDAFSRRSRRTRDFHGAVPLPLRGIFNGEAPNALSMKPEETTQAEYRAVDLLREELVACVKKILSETSAPASDKDRLDRIRAEAHHLETLFGEHLTAERIRIIDVVQPLWVPNLGGGEPATEPPPMPPDPLAGSIVVVDDESKFREPLVQQLRREGYECVEFGEGERALSYLEGHPCQMVLLDVLMPGMSGREVLEKIKGSPKLRDTPVIMTAERSELEHIAGSIHEGAEDFLAKPYNPTIVRARVASSIQRNQLRELEQRTFLALVKSQELLAREIAEAADYVTSLLPKKLSAPVPTDWRYIPSSELGGDSFGYHWVDDDHLAMYLLDVCGHGVGAALLSVSAVNVLRTASLPDTDFNDPAAVMRGLNTAFPMEKHNNMFFTAWYGVYSRSTRKVRFACGGHPPALLLCAEGTMDALKARGTVIGAFPEAKFETGEIMAPPGSRLYLFSDGAYEIERSDSSLMTHGEFSKLLSECPGEYKLDSVVSQVMAQQKSPEFSDDFSIIEFHFPGEAKDRGDTLTLNADIGDLSRINGFLREFCSSKNLPGELVFDLEVILEELITNVIKYGGCKQGSECCTVELSVDGSNLNICFSDCGAPFNPLDRKEVDTNKPAEDRPIGGLGIHFIRNLTDSQHYARLGDRNVLTMTRKIGNRH